MNSKKGFVFHIIFFVMLSLVIIGGILFVYISKNIIGYTEYDVDYTVGDYAGFNLDEDAIHFGTIMQGIKTKRSMDIYTDRDVEVRIYIAGIEYITISEDVFFLKANEKKSIDLVLQVPLELKEGYYSGKIRVIYRKPK
tara:strand:- start:89 stop:505 length:417 start_codon:yes stop_codon:yes gene_type:complete